MIFRFEDYTDASNLNDFIITKAKEITMFKIQCPDCGWENSLEVMAHYCPKCGRNLKLMTLVDIGESNSNECIGGIDMSST